LNVGGGVKRASQRARAGNAHTRLQARVKGGKDSLLIKKAIRGGSHKKPPTAIEFHKRSAGKVQTKADRHRREKGLHRRSCRRRG